MPPSSACIRSGSARRTCMHMGTHACTYALAHTHACRHAYTCIHTCTLQWHAETCRDWDARMHVHTMQPFLDVLGKYSKSARCHLADLLVGTTLDANTYGLCRRAAWNDAAMCSSSLPVTVTRALAPVSVWCCHENRTSRTACLQEWFQAGWNRLTWQT